MESKKYLEGQSFQRLPLFESDGFIYWKNRFETYVKSKDLDLWHVITDEVEKTKDETCLVAQAPDEICLRINLEPDKWIKDSGCSKHMTGYRKLFSSYKAYNEGNIIFRSNFHGKIIGKDYLTKFDQKSYKGVFLRYLQNSKAYIILNKQTMKVEESLNVTFDETPPPLKTPPLEDDELVEEEAIEEMLKKFGLEDSKPIKTPMSTETKLTRDKEEDPKISHLEAVKRIFRYIKGTTYLGLWYPKGSGIETIVFADSDHARDYVDRKSTSGVCMFLGCCLTSWFSKKQTDLSISTTEVKYVSAEKACQQALWMIQALVDYVVRLDDIPIMCDNKGDIDLTATTSLHHNLHLQPPSTTADTMPLPQPPSPSHHTTAPITPPPAAITTKKVVIRTRVRLVPVSAKKRMFVLWYDNSYGAFGFAVSHQGCLDSGLAAIGLLGLAYYTQGSVDRARKQ
uniref:Uncharacterized mitochondrial protein AtMg00810-like n=1 Tax=Tanacetum cinerariifolium TaxID=118510 RepID=A0A6L2NYF7_TANCI|nr:uncharacterized mitochondrial protein AtMg00810-like [Tanacetum cinerariifolium]